MILSPSRLSAAVMCAALTVPILGGCGDDSPPSRGTMAEGVSAAQRGDLDSAERVFRAALEANPRAGDAHQNLGSLLMERANAAQAADDHASAEQLAREAVGHFDSAITGNPRGQDVSLLLAGRLLVLIGEPQRARDRLRRYLSYDSGTTAQREEARALLEDADTMMLYVEAIDLLMPRIDAHGREVERTEEWQASVTRGVSLLEEFATARPDHAAAHWFLGKARTALGEDEEAYASFERAARLPGANEDFHRELAIAAIRIGRFEEGLRAARAALALSPDAPDLRANLALALLMVGQVEEAREAIDRAHEDAPEDPITARLRDRVIAVQEGRSPRPTSLEQLERD